MMRLVQKCSVCKQEICIGPWTYARISEGLIGCAPFEFCCCCRQTVSDHEDIGYRRRFKKWYRKQKAQRQFDEAKRLREEEERRLSSEIDD